MTQPTACSLSGAEYRERAGEIRALLRTALVGRTTIERGERLTFTDAEGVRERVEALIVAETKCCPFLTFALDVQRGRLVVDVTQPEPTGGEEP